MPVTPHASGGPGRWGVSGRVCCNSRREPPYESVLVQRARVLGGSFAVRSRYEMPTAQDEDPLRGGLPDQTKQLKGWWRAFGAHRSATHPTHVAMLCGHSRRALSTAFASSAHVLVVLDYVQSQVHSRVHRLSHDHRCRTGHHLHRLRDHWLSVSHHRLSHHCRGGRRRLLQHLHRLVHHSRNRRS